MPFYVSLFALVVLMNGVLLITPIAKMDDDVTLGQRDCYFVELVVGRLEGYGHYILC